MANKYWIGSTSSSGSSWNVAGNWSGSGVPATGDVIYLNNTYSTRNLTMDVAPTIGALYTTGFTGSIVLGSGNNLTVTGPPGDIILDPSMSFTTNNPGSNTITYNNGTSNSGSVNLNGVTLPTSFRPNIGFRLTGSMNILYNYVLGMPNNANVNVSGSVGSAIYCGGSITNGGATLYTFLNNVDFYMIGTGAQTVGSSALSNNNFLCPNFYISSSNGSGSFTIYGLNLILGYGQAATYTGSFEYTNGSGLRLASLAGVNGQFGISTAVNGQMINVQVNNKTNPSDRIQFDPASVIALGINGTTPQNLTIMSDIVVTNNGVIQLNPGATGTCAYYSFSGSRFVFREGVLFCNGGGGSNYNGTVTCSFEGPSTFTFLQANATWRLPVIMNMGISTLTLNNLGTLNNYIEYRSGKITTPTDRYFFLNGATFVNAHKAGLAGANHFLIQAGTTNTLNEFPSGISSKPTIIRSTTAGSPATINLVDGLSPSYLPISASNKYAKNIIASNINVTGKPVYVLNRIAPQVLRFSYVSAPAGGTGTLQSRTTNVGIRYVNESFFGFTKGDSSNATTTIGGTLARNIGAMTYGWGLSAQATDPTRAGF